MNKNKYMPTLVCGFSAAVLTTIPGIKTFGCCVIVPVAVWFAFMLDHRINKSEPMISTNKAFIFGILTGLFAALFTTLFDIIITFITHSNDFVESLPQTESAMRSLNLGEIWEQTFAILKSMSKEITTNGFSLFYTIGTLLSNIIIDIIFGILGGLLAMVLKNKKAK